MFVLQWSLITRFSKREGEIFCRGSRGELLPRQMQELGIVQVDLLKLAQTSGSSRDLINLQTRLLILDLMSSLSSRPIMAKNILKRGKRPWIMIAQRVSSPRVRPPKLSREELSLYLEWQSSSTNKWSKP